MTDVTVVMPVHNAMPYLDAAIESVLAQTHTRFGLAIYDDASSDGSYQRALDWASRDKRIAVKRGETRLGPCGSSNAAARLAETELVARMDGDDIAMPERLELQLKALHDHPDAVLVGSTFDMIDGEGQIIRPAVPSRIAGAAPPFAHPSIMYRRSAFEAAGGYIAGDQSSTDWPAFCWSTRPTAG
jgi:glycosyltransferase involved in cell wall biosynthesis